MLMSSSTSGLTNTEVKLVWRRLSESKGDLRTSRCTPISVFSQPKAYSPSTLKVALLMPATFAGAHFHQLGLPAAAFAEAQVHAQQHLGPVLRLGAAGAGLDVDEAVGGVEFAGEHAAELELLHARGDLADVADHGLDGAFVVVRLGHVQKFRGVEQAVGVLADLGDGLLQRGALLAERLGPFGIVPDRRILQLAAYFLEPFDLGIEVKDTSGANRACSSGRRCAGGRGRRSSPSASPGDADGGGASPAGSRRYQRSACVRPMSTPYSAKPGASASTNASASRASMARFAPGHQARPVHFGAQVHGSANRQVASPASPASASRCKGAMGPPAGSISKWRSNCASPGQPGTGRARASMRACGPLGRRQTPAFGQQQDRRGARRRPSDAAQPP
jgi:hypothetical protein